MSGKLEMTPHDQAKTARIRAGWTPDKERAARLLMDASGQYADRPSTFAVPPLFMMIVDGLWSYDQLRQQLVETLNAQ